MRKLSYSLAEDWKPVYVAALQTLSGRKKDDPEAKRARRILRDLSDELRRARGGPAWIPEPDSYTGRYPKIGEIPYRALASATRKNTEKPKRQAAWERVKENVKPMKMQNTGPSWGEERKAAAAAASAFPQHKGRASWYLGRKVPGEMFRKSSSGSVVDLKEVSPEEWSSRGFSPLKFSKAEKVKEVLSKTGRKWQAMPLPRRLATAGFAAGLAGAGSAAKGNQTDTMDEELKQTIEQHGMNFEEALCYEAGRELATYERGDASWWKNFMDWVRNLGADYRAKAVPEIKREMTRGVLQRVHKETDLLPPIEVGGRPLRRKGMLDESLGRFSKDKLRTMQNKLQRLAADERRAGRSDRAQEIERQLSIISSELTLR